MRVGQGYDSHRLEFGGRPLVIGGIAFPGGNGVVAHSDGDALMHAITDAVLGAVGEPDIGQLFPDRDPAWAGAASERFLVEALRRVKAAGWEIGNVDATVILDAPKLGPRKDEVRANLARVLGVGVDQVNVKGKTHERRPDQGPDDRIEAMAVVLLVRA